MYIAKESICCTLCFIALKKVMCKWYCSDATTITTIHNWFKRFIKAMFAENQRCHPIRLRYIDRCKVWIPRLPTETVLRAIYFSKRFFLKKRFEFCTKKCSIENTFDLIDLQLSRSLDFGRKFFSPFDGTGKVYELLPQDETIHSAKYWSISLTNWEPP